MIRKQKGFTLVELIIVVGIFVILFGMVFNVRGSFLTNSYLDANTELILQQLRVARTRAVNREGNADWGVQFNSGTGVFTLFKGNDFLNRDTSFDIPITLPSSISMSGVNINGGGTEVIFDKGTGESGTYGSIILSTPELVTNTISINPKGLIAVNETDGGGPPDVTAPNAISDLASSGANATTISLTWTASGDDGNVGTATSYDIRYSTSLIDDSNWDSAIQASGEPTPSTAGSTETFTVTGLSPLTTYYFAIKTADEVPNESSISNVISETTIAVGDITPPAAISDLTTSNATTSSIDLSWTAPGDDGNTGTATSYDIRYATTLITELNWSSATQVTGEPTPTIAGTTQTQTVNGLTANTTYYFAIKTADEVPNESLISNIANATTLSASTEASNLSLNSSGVALGNANKDVTGITITNTGASSITIDRMTVAWTGGTNGNNLQSITINGTAVISGNINSGTDSDITNFVLAAGQTYNINALAFKKSMSGANISITFTMLDGSSVSYTNITP